MRISIWMPLRSGETRCPRQARPPRDRRLVAASMVTGIPPSDRAIDCAVLRACAIAFDREDDALDLGITLPPNVCIGMKRAGRGAEPRERCEHSAIESRRSCAEHFAAAASAPRLAQASATTVGSASSGVPSKIRSALENASPVMQLPCGAPPPMARTAAPRSCVRSSDDRADSPA